MTALGLYDADGVLDWALSQHNAKDAGSPRIALHQVVTPATVGTSMSRLKACVDEAERRGWTTHPVVTLDVGGLLLDAGRLLARVLDAWSDRVLTVVVGTGINDDTATTLVAEGVRRCASVVRGFGAPALLLAPPVLMFADTQASIDAIEPRWRERPSRREVRQWQVARACASAGADGVLIYVRGAPLSSLDYLECVSTSRRRTDDGHAGGASWVDMRDASIYGWRASDASAPVPIFGVTASVVTAPYPRGWLTHLHNELSQLPNIEFLLRAGSLDVVAVDGPDADARNDFAEGLRRWT